MNVEIETTFNSLGEKVVLLRIASPDGSHCVDTILEYHAALRMAKALETAAMSCEAKEEVQ